MLTSKWLAVVFTLCCAAAIGCGRGNGATQAPPEAGGVQPGDVGDAHDGVDDGSSVTPPGDAFADADVFDAQDGARPDTDADVTVAVDADGGDGDGESGDGASDTLDPPTELRCSDENWVRALTVREPRYAAREWLSDDRFAACSNGIRVSASREDVPGLTSVGFSTRTSTPVGYAPLTPTLSVYLGVDGDIVFGGHVVVEVAAYEPDDPRNEDAVPFAAPFRWDGTDETMIVPDAWTRTEWGWRIELDAPDALVMAAPVTCGNGVIDPGETCDGQRWYGNSACTSDCQVRYDYTCTGDPLECEPTINYLDCDRIESHPCTVAEFEPLSQQCFIRNLNDDMPCDWSDEAAGFCRDGECVPGPVEGSRCRAEGEDTLAWGMFLDGRCHPTEYWQLIDYEPGVRFGSRCNNCDDYVLCSARIPFFAPQRLDIRTTIVHRPGGWLAGWSVPTPSERWFITQVDNGEGEGVFMELPFDPDGDWVESEYQMVHDFGLIEFDWMSEFAECEGLGGLAVGAIKFSETGSPLCDIAVDVDGEWQHWPVYTDAAPCTVEDCTLLSEDPENCGACGNECGSLEICEGGSCVCHPLIFDEAPESCGGCEPGVGGVYCDIPCPGQIGSGVVCNGQGLCNDTPLGNGACFCMSGFHGDACEFSCTDGIRNGTELSMDCGGDCRPCGAF
jgi:hypothetical protein